MSGSIDAAALFGLLKSLDASIQSSLKSMAVPNSPSKAKAGPVREEQVSIYVRVVFLKLGEIDTIKEQFSADCFVQSTWREEQLDGKGKNEEMDLINWGDFWNPELTIDNCIGDPKESVWYKVLYDKEGLANICERRRVKGVFFEKMELYQYPFDTQDLTLSISTQRGEHELVLQVDPCEISQVNTQSFTDEQEWSLHKHISSWSKVTTNAYRSADHKHPALFVSCKATRRYDFFLWNIILIMIFICGMVFTTFTVKTELVQNRLQLSFILLLSNITFKFSVTNTIPKVSYLTYLDRYIIISMVIMCIVCVWHAVVYRLSLDYGNEWAANADNIALGVIGCGWILYNLAFFSWTMGLMRYKLKFHLKKEKEQSEMLDKMKDNLEKAKRSQILPHPNGQEV